LPVPVTQIAGICHPNCGPRNVENDVVVFLRLSH